MATANLSVGIDTTKAHNDLKELKTWMKTQFGQMPVTIKTESLEKSIKSALSPKGGGYDLKINTKKLRDDVAAAMKDAMAKVKVGGVIDTQSLKTQMAELANVVNDAKPKVVKAAADTGKAAGKSFAAGLEEEAKKAKISYRIKEGAGSISASLPTNFTAEQVKARAEEAKADAAAQARMLRQASMMRANADLERQHFVYKLSQSQRVADLERQNDVRKVGASQRVADLERQHFVYKLSQSQRVADLERQNDVRKVGASQRVADLERQHFVYKLSQSQRVADLERQNDVRKVGASQRVADLERQHFVYKLSQSQRVADLERQNDVRKVGASQRVADLERQHFVYKLSQSQRVADLERQNDVRKVGASQRVADLERQHFVYKLSQSQRVADLERQNAVNQIRLLERKAELERANLRAQTAAAFAQGKALAPDNLTAKGKGKYGAEYAIAQGFPQQLLPNGAAGLLQATDGLEKGIKKVGAAHTEATGKTKAHTAAMHDAHSAARGLASGMGMMWLTWGNIAPLLAGASLSHGFIQAMKAGTEFAYQLTFVKALGGETAESITQISSAALELSKSGLFGPVELSNGLRTLSQAGLNATESMKALPIALDLATVGEMSMKDAAITLVGVMTAFDLEKSDLSKIGDTFAKAAAVSQTSVEQMTQAMKTASVVGEQYGASMQDTATALTLLAKVNITGTAAGTSLRNMLKELYTPTDKAAKVMKEVGISARTATGDLKPFPDVIFALKKSLEGYNKAGQVKILQDLFGERGAKEAIVMLSQTREEWNKLNRTIGESGGFMRSVAAELEGTVKGSFKQAINTLQATLIEAYNSTEGAAGELAGRLKETFGSAQFKDAVMGIVNGMVALTNALVAMAPALTMAAGGWLALKAAMIGAAAWNAAATALTGATIATQTLGAVALRTATTMTGATGLLAAARMLPGVLGAAGASLIATTGVLGPLAIAIGVAGTAWYLFRDKTLEAMEQSSEAVARGAASMRESLAGVLREVHNVSAAASRKSLDAAMPALVSGQSELLEMKQKLKNTYKISSDKEVEEFLAKATSTNSTGEVYTQTGAKYDAITAYLKAKTEQKKALQDFARVSKTVESVAEQERMNADKPVVPPKTLKDYNGAGAGSGRADREAAKLENANVLDLEKRYQAELKTADAYYARLQKVESTSAQYGIKTKEEAESKITALTEEHWAMRLEKVSAMSAEMSALLGSSVKLSEADAQKAKTFVATAQEEINTLKEKISWIKEEAKLKAQGAEVRFNKDLRGAADELEKERQARGQKIAGPAEDPISRARSEGELAAELKYTKIRTEAEEELRVARLGNDQAAIEASERRRNTVLETIALEKAATADYFETLERYKQSAQYGWDQFWVKYRENALTSAQLVEKSLDSVVGHVEGAFSEFLSTGTLDAKAMLKGISDDIAKLALKSVISKAGAGLTEAFGFGTAAAAGKEGAGAGGGGAGDLLAGAGTALMGFWKSLTGATAATDSSAASTVKDVIQLGIKTSTETTATTSVATLATSATAASAALQALAASTAAKAGADTAGTALKVASVAAAAAKGAAFDGSVSYFANGGVVNSPTMFKFADGVGMMGEAGPEAIMPLARDSQGKLGVRYEPRPYPEQSKQASQPVVQPNNIRIVNAFDTSVVGDYMGSVEGEKIVMNAIRRNQGAVSRMVSAGG